MWPGGLDGPSSPSSVTVPVSTPREGVGDGPVVGNASSPQASTTVSRRRANSLENGRRQASVPGEDSAVLSRIKTPQESLTGELLNSKVVTVKFNTTRP